MGIGPSFGAPSARRGDRHLGVLVPAGNVAHARELARLLPAGVACRVLPFENPDAQAPGYCDRLAGCLAAPLLSLAEWQAETVLLGCTTASMLCSGIALRSRLAAAAGCPIVTAAEAVAEALAALDVRALAVVTPYGDAANCIIIDFLRDLGVRVAALEGLAFDGSPEQWANGVRDLGSSELIDIGLSLVRTAPAGAAEGLFLPCTAIESLDAIDRFEQQTGLPALSSAQAGTWAALHRLGVDGRRPGFGRLFDVWDFRIG